MDESGLMLESDNPEGLESRGYLFATGVML